MSATENGFMVICTQTGTVLGGEHCVVVMDSCLTEEEWDQLEEMSDSEVCKMAKSRGTKVSQLGPDSASLALAKAQARLRKAIEDLPNQVL